MNTNKQNKMNIYERKKEGMKKRKKEKEWETSVFHNLAADF